MLFFLACLQLSTRICKYSVRYVLAQEAVPTFNISAIGFRESEQNGHQSIEGVDPPVATRPQAIETSNAATTLLRTPRPHSTGSLRGSHTHSFTILHPTDHAPSLLPPSRGDGGNSTGRQPPGAAPAGDRTPQRKKISTVALVFACLGGVALVLILLAFMRCLYVWRRTPSRDRIAGLLNRHHLEREMEGREREELARRVQQRTRPTWRPPPPPYQPAPAYDATTEPPPMAQV